MDWIRRFVGFAESKAPDQTDETIINGAPYDGHELGDSSVRSDLKAPVANSEPTAEEIKRRQVSLALRYVTAIRAR